ncbi:hypothetical protein [Flavobacterium tegetincola]|uniref:hypothetical protein n=1 Tax=Flavobacterium tegetincola TaxID=150172 RepID=UPI00040EE62B|nr:hypothetical protein [Flavobacterium tegetincola]
MKAIRNVSAKIVRIQFKKAIFTLAVISVLTFMSSCTAEELPLNEEAEIIVPVDGVEADGDVESVPPILGGSTYQPPKK